MSKDVVRPAVTSEKRVVNPVGSSSGSGDESVADNFFYFLRITKIDQLLSN